MDDENLTVVDNDEDIPGNEAPISESTIEDISDSILITIKKMIGLDSEFHAFDTDMIILINSCFSTLFQLGVGPQDQAFRISGDTENWSEFLDDRTNIESVKEYIYLKCKVVFDPPVNSFVVTAFSERIKELEWRLNAEDDPGWKNGE